ncbi:hypothetical protein BJY04DRAFT_222951 [Aspergillus karnatakaensis]|uniref:uncharacterized protein n=1 Tax=Aspergillus karnatakaensis TaxID=1810916 RepID=UPI003CCCEAE0
MVLGIAMMATMVPTILGLNEASNATRNSEENRKENARKSRSGLLAVCNPSEGSLSQREQVHNAKVYLGRDHKLYISKHPDASMTPFNGHFYNHPDFEDDNLSGLVAMSAEDKPLARWIFVDQETNEVRWGGRADSEGHVCGPFDLAVGDEWLVLNDTQRWMAIKGSDAQLPEDSDASYDPSGETWQLYFDLSGMEGEDLPSGSQKMRIFLRRILAQY